MQRAVGVTLAAIVALLAGCTSDDAPSPVVQATGESAARASTGGSRPSQPGTGAEPSDSASGSSGNSRPATGEVDVVPSSAADGSTPSDSGTNSLRFSRVDDPDLEPRRRGGQFTTLDVLGGQGFVIGGTELASDGAPVPVVWRSVDGAAWTRTDLPLATEAARVTASVVDEDRLLLFGSDPVSGQPLVWSVASSGEIEEVTPPSDDVAWSVAAAQQWGDALLLWGETGGDAGRQRVFAVTSDDDAGWAQVPELNQLLSGHRAREVIDVSSGRGGTAALLVTERGDFLVLVDDGRGWTASVLDPATASVGGLEVTEEVRLAGSSPGRRGPEPSLFELSANGRWEPRAVDIVPDDRNAGFQSSAGDRLRDSFLDGRLLTGNVAAAEIIAVPAGRGSWLEAAYPEALPGQGQPMIDQVVRSGDVTLAIAGDRPAVVRVDRFAVTPVGDASFPSGSSVPSAAGLVVEGEELAFRGAYTSVPAGVGAGRRSWARWIVDQDGSVAVDRGGEQLELADLEPTRDGALFGVGYESFVPANFEGFIEPYEFVDVGNRFRSRRVGGRSRTVRFHHVADTGPAVVAAAAVFDRRGELDAAFFRRDDDGTWTLASAPPPDSSERTTSVELVDMCPLPGAGAVLFTGNGRPTDAFRTYVTTGGTSWQRFVPRELAGRRTSVLGCAAAADHVLAFGSVDGAARLWRTVDGQRFTAVALPGGIDLVDVAVDGSGSAWLLTAEDHVVQLGDGAVLSDTALSDDQLTSPAGPAELTDIAVTRARVAVLGSWNGGVGLWTAIR